MEILGGAVSNDRQTRITDFFNSGNDRIDNGGVGGRDVTNGVTSGRGQRFHIGQGLVVVGGVSDWMVGLESGPDEDSGLDSGDDEDMEPEDGTVLPWTEDPVDDVVGVNLRRAGSSYHHGSMRAWDVDDAYCPICLEVPRNGEEICVFSCACNCFMHRECHVRYQEGDAKKQRDTYTTSPEEMERRERGYDLCPLCDKVSRFTVVMGAQTYYPGTGKLDSAIIID